jgi:hypothetical protein
MACIDRILYATRVNVPQKAPPEPFSEEIHAGFDPPLNRSRHFRFRIVYHNAVLKSRFDLKEDPS